MGEVAERVTGNGKLSSWVRGMKLRVDGRAIQNRKQGSKEALSGDLISRCADSSLAFSALFNKQYKVSQAECVH